MHRQLLKQPKNRANVWLFFKNGEFIMNDAVQNAIINYILKLKHSHVKEFHPDTIREHFSQYQILPNFGQLINSAIDKLVKQGKIIKKYLICNPENIRERKVFTRKADIPEEIDFDFVTIYVEPDSIKTVYSFEKKA